MVIVNEFGSDGPIEDPDEKTDPIDPDAPQEWTATRWDEGGGVARDNKGNSVIFDTDGTVATSTPDGSSLTRADGSAFEDHVDWENPDESFTTEFR
jgi:hypothetical protein